MCAIFNIMECVYQDPLLPLSITNAYNDYVFFRFSYISDWKHKFTSKNPTKNKEYRSFQCSKALKIKLKYPLRDFCKFDTIIKRMSLIGLHEMDFSNSQMMKEHMILSYPNCH